MRIRHVEVIPAAFADPPLLNARGLHEPYALRTFVRVELEDGTVGWGEGAPGGGWDGPGTPGMLTSLGSEQVTTVLAGIDPMATNQIYAALVGIRPDASVQELMRGFSPIEVACLDAAGRRLGVSVAQLLGGSVRSEVEYSAYLFYKWASHPGAAPDEWGAAETVAGMVDQAAKMVRDYGFRSLKLKGGMHEPEFEIETIRALRREFPHHPLRIDPNGAWTVDTACRVAAQLEADLEYLEDPVLSIDGMAQVHQHTSLPLATNMCVIERGQIAEAYRKGAVQVILSDHHYWGGLRRTQELAATCDALGVGVSMHSNSHLGISLAAMTIVGSTLPNLAYACDTHYPWNKDSDVVEPGTFHFRDGFLEVPQGPGLGIEVNEQKVRELQANYETVDISVRNDTDYLKRFVPDFDGDLPRY